MAKQFTYNKNQKIKSRTQLSELFTQSPNFLVFPIKIFYKIADASYVPLQAGVGVSKRHFKKAVHRNRIKRLLREYHRLTKLNLENQLQLRNKSLQIFYLYIHNELPTLPWLLEKQTAIQQKIITALHESAV